MYIKHPAATNNRIFIVILLLNATRGWRAEACWEEAATE
jgi:hypothetical protein